MTERLYDDLAPWWALLTPPEAQAEDAAACLSILEGVAGPVRTLLELGSASGSLAANLPEEVEVVLVDRSPAMLDQSRAHNPEREHLCADMRDVRLGRHFDAVLLHDAVMYLTTPEDLAAALHTAAVHCRPGGSVLILPDAVREGWVEHSIAGGRDAGDGRAVRLLEWHWDPDPTDCTVSVEMALLLREADGSVRCVHETHTMGVFDLETWARALRAAGLELTLPEGPLPEGVGEVLLARHQSRGSSPGSNQDTA